MASCGHSFEMPHSGSTLSVANLASLGFDNPSLGKVV